MTDGGGDGWLCALKPSGIGLACLPLLILS